jgi:thiol-disulfide isomerase/thioredoxin
MKRIFLSALLILSGIYAMSQTVSVIKFPQLQAMMQRHNDTTYVFNFWATWCSPCVEEFPNFQKFSASNSNTKVKVIFISMDFKKDLDQKLNPFLKNHDVKNQVYLLDDQDYNSWIDKVDKSWNGDLPATLVVNNKSGVHKLYPHPFTLDQLEQTLKPYIN